MTRQPDLLQEAKDARYAAFLARCAEEAGRSHSAEEIEAAAALLGLPGPSHNLDILPGANHGF